MSLCQGSPGREDGMCEAAPSQPGGVFCTQSSCLVWLCRAASHCLSQMSVRYSEWSRCRFARAMTARGSAILSTPYRQAGRTRQWGIFHGRERKAASLDLRSSQALPLSMYALEKITDPLNPPSVVCGSSYFGSFGDLGCLQGTGALHHALKRGSSRCC